MNLETSPTTREACPSDDQLQALSEGSLPDGAWDGVAEHVGQCLRCEAALQALPEPDSQLLSALRGLTGKTVAFEAGLAPRGAITCGDGPVESGDAEEVLPRNLRDYRLLECLGRGGMGAVYRAVHTRLDRVVALKVLTRQRYRDADAVGRFGREMIAIGKLEHPNIVRATDAGEVDGTHYLAMEYVAGLDLARLMKRHGTLTPADACELVRQAALGLHYVHAHGLIHRDIKPSNLMLTAAGRVKVLDLGLALLVRDKPAGDISTESGFIMGSFDYLAPEQGDRPGAVDARADLYGLGCTLYHLLAGHPPFPSPRYNTPLQKMLAHTREAVPPLEAARADVPPRLSQALGKMLAKDPADRFASAAEVAEALEEFTAGADLLALLAPAGLMADTWEVAGTSMATYRMPRADPAQQPPARRPGPARPRRAWRWAVAAGLLVAAALATLGILYVSTDAGTLEIVTDDPAVKVIVEQAGNRITVIDPASRREIKLSAGKYGLRLSENGKNLKMDNDAFTLTRGERKVVTIRRLAPAAGGLPPLAPAWLKAVATLAPEKQAEEVARELRRLNPGFDGKIVPSIEGDAVTALEFKTDEVTDLRPLAALRRLTKLVCRGSAPRAGKLNDLGPLKGLPLTDLDCSLNRIWNLRALQGMPLKRLNCCWTRVADLKPLEGMPLEYLHCAETPVSNLDPLKGLPLRELLIPSTKVKDLSPLQHVRGLQKLTCYHTEIEDLSPLRGLPLDHLDCNATRVADLSPLKGMPLGLFLCSKSAVKDLAPLRGMKTLRHLQCFETAVSDLRPLQGLRLEHLDIGDTQVEDLSPLRGMPLSLLACRNSRVKDFAPLRGAPLRDLRADVVLERDAEVLRSLKGLVGINEQTVKDFWKQSRPKGP